MALSGRRQQDTTDRPASSAAPALVGRDEALSTVIGALEQGSALVVVEGEPGIGKTRLLREAVAAADDDASAANRVLVATCPAVPEPAPLGAVVAAIRRLRPRVDSLGLSPLAGALRPLFPEWSVQLPPAPAPMEEPSAVRHLLFRALSELIEQLGIETVVVEDVHWADVATLEWLLTLCADEPSPSRRLSIVVSYRPWDVPADSLLPRLTTRTPPGRTWSRVELAPLGLDQVRQLVASMYRADDVSEQFAAFLLEATDGIPLTVEEYLLLLEDREDIVRLDGGWHRRLVAELEVPPTVRDSVLERVYRLDLSAQRILNVAGILAELADEPLLAEVAGLDGNAARAGLAGALASGLLRERGPGQFAFRHVLDAQAISDSVPAPERRQLHGRAVQALRNRDHVRPARLARHAWEAGDSAAWAQYAERSAVLALESGDDRTAVETLRQVIDTIEPTVEERVRLTRTLGEAAFFGGAALGDLTEQVVRILRDALADARVDGPERGELRLLLGRMLWTMDKPAAFEQWEAAVADLTHRPDLAIRAMSNLALPLVPDWPAARHRQWLERAGELVDRVADADRLAHLRMRMTALLLLGDVAGWAALREVPGTAATAADARALANTLVNAVLATLAWGRFDEAGEHLDTTCRHIEASEYSRLGYGADSARAFLDWYIGAWSGLAERTRSLAESDDVDAPYRSHALQVLGLVTTAGGDIDTGRWYLREAIAAHDRLGVIGPAAFGAPAALARLLLIEGDVGEALAITDPVVAMIMHKGVWMWFADIACVHLDAMVAAGRVDEAEQLVATFSGELDGRDIPTATAALATSRAVVAEARGVAAAELFAEAAVRWGELPRPYDSLLCRERQGRAVLGTGDEAVAVRVLTEAERGLRELGARWDADRVAQTVREHGGEVARAWRGGRRGYGDALSPRELDVVRFVVRGMTNRETAEALFVSRRTVDGHVQSAMRKLGAASRTALAVAAMEAGYVERNADQTGHTGQPRGE